MPFLFHTTEASLAGGGLSAAPAPPAGHRRPGSAGRHWGLRQERAAAPGHPVSRFVFCAFWGSDLVLGILDPQIGLEKHAQGGGVVLLVLSRVLGPNMAGLVWGSKKGVGVEWLYQLFGIGPAWHLFKIWEAQQTPLLQGCLSVSFLLGGPRKNGATGFLFGSHWKSTRVPAPLNREA